MQAEGAEPIRLSIAVLLAAGLCEVAAAAGAPPLTRIENSIGVSCGARFTNATLSAAALLALLAEESIVTRAPGLED